jgi:hypothetical protein
MRSHQRLYGLLIAAALVAAPPLAFAKHDGGDNGGGPPPGHGGGNGGGGGNGNGGDHGPPPSNPGGGNNGGTKVHPPQGTCTDDSAGVDLQGPDGQSGSSHVAHTNFGLMDITTGASVASNESATMMYFWFGSTFDYVLNAHQLPAGSQWTLTYQPEPLPSSGVMCLGNATVNGGGQLHLANSLELTSNLPPALDPTADPSTQPPDALLALVPSADVDCTGGTMTNFEPNAYLWSNPRVRFIDTDLLPAVQ